MNDILIMLLFVLAAACPLGYTVGTIIGRHKSSRDSRVKMLERRVADLVRENDELELRLAGKKRRMVDLLPIAPATIAWRDWARTLGDDVAEWERWDETDSWYLTVHERKDGRWRWHAAFAPDEAEDALSVEGICDTAATAQKAAQFWADEHARRPLLLQALATGDPITLAIKEGEGTS
jgi:hypothetical protein